MGGVTGVGTIAGGVIGGVVAFAAMIAVPLFAVMAGAAELAWVSHGAR